MMSLFVVAELCNLLETAHTAIAIAGYRDAEAEPSRTRSAAITAAQVELLIVLGVRPGWVCQGKESDIPNCKRSNFISRLSNAYPWEVNEEAGLFVPR